VTADALPSSWRQTTLGEVAAPVPNAIVDGPFGSNLKLSDYVEEGVPVLQGKNITNDSFRWFDIRFISDRKARELKRSSVGVGDILIVKIGSIGYSAIVEDLNGFDFAIIPANLAKVTPDATKIDLGYLHRWLTSVEAKRYLIGVASKTAQPALSLGKIKGLPLPLPPLAEQRRIAEVLGQAEALRAKRRGALAQLESLTQSLFLDLFGDPVINPKCFPKCKVSEAVSRLTNGFVGPTRDIYHETGVPYLLARHVKANRLRFDGKTFISAAFNRKHSKSILKAGDVLLVQSGHVGESAVVPPDHEGHNCHAMIVITPRPELLSGHFLSQLFSTAAMRRAFGGIETGITLAHLNCRDVRELSIPLPPLELQREFARRVTAVEKLKTAQRASLAELDALFATLQHRAFRGEL